MVRGLRKLYLLVLKPTAESGECLHGITVWFFFKGWGKRRLDNKSSHQPKKKKTELGECVCRCPGSNSLEVTETVGWLCPCRCKSLRSRLKRVDPPTPACMATLFFFFIPPFTAIGMLLEQSTVRSAQSNNNTHMEATARTRKRKMIFYRGHWSNMM